MPKNFVGPPLLTQLDRGPLQIPVVLFKLALKPGQQRKRVAGGTRKAREDLIVVEPADFLCAGLHNRLADGHLPVAGHGHASITPHQ